MINRITIAALLHDIGKFYQRGQPNVSMDSDLYRKHEKLMTLICPENRYGQLGYKHAFWTYKFFEDFSSKFKELTHQLDSEFEGDSLQFKEDNLINLAIYHHNPHSKGQALIQLADWWSSGLDRGNDSFAKETVSDQPIKFGSGSFRKRPLESIFQNIKLDEEKQSNRYAYPLKALDLQRENVFPTPLLQKNVRDLTRDYKTLYTQFIEDFEKVPTKSFRAFIDTTDHVLKKFTWCIPSSTQGLSNVSLYNHLKTTAGIAACLYQYKEECLGDNIVPYEYNSSDHRLRVKENHYPVLLTCVDISGIQSFIYNIASRKAAMSLKGRSYYLQLLIESVISQILTHPDIQLTNVQTIYSSGGKAYLFLPNTPKTRQALTVIEQELQRGLWKTHKLSLYVCLGKVPFRYKFDKQEDGSYDAGIVTTEEEMIGMEELWRRVSEKASEKKGRKMESIITSDESNGEMIFEELFGDGEQGIELEYTDKFDACTSEPLYGKDFKNLTKKDDGEAETYVSEYTYLQSELGKVLKDADFNFSFSEHHKFEDYSYDTRFRLTIRPLQGKRGFHLFDDIELINNDAEFRKIVSSSDVHCNMLNRTDFMQFYLKGYNASYGFSFYGGNKQPKNNKGDLLTFHELAIDDKGSSTKLGILRMDVDNLGSIFIRGLDPELKTFSAYATLSSQLDLFFSGYLNTIRNSEKYKNHVVILYSGGDDVFALGRWDKVLDFGIDLRGAFKKYTCNNSDIDISAGFITTGAKFPISKGAELAGEAESKAKSFKREVGGKKIDRSAITLFDTSIGWEEWETIIKYKELFEEIISKKENGKSVLHRIQQTKTIKDYQEKNSESLDYSYLWRLLYFLKRFANAGISDQIELISREILHKNQSRNLDLMAVAARWVELLNGIKQK